MLEPHNRFFARTVSISSLHEKGIDLTDSSDDSLVYEGELQNEQILTKLTKRQREVISLLLDGYKRKEAAAKLNVKLQAIHQIVLRIRRRLQKKQMIDYQHLYTTKQMRLVKNVVYVFCLSSSIFVGRDIYMLWSSHPVLKDYHRPELEKIENWCEEFIKELKPDEN